MDQVKERLRGLTADSMERYLARLKRLLDEGWREGSARALACGIPPDDVKNWPPRIRYDMAIVERAGASREDAAKEIRRRLDEWWFRTHSYDEKYDDK